MFFYVLEDEKLVPFLTRKPHKSKEFNVIGNIYDESYEFMSKSLDGETGPLIQSVKLVDRVKDGNVVGRKFVLDTDPETKDNLVVLNSCNSYTEGKLVTTHKKGTPCFHNGHVVEPGDYAYENGKGIYKCRSCGARLMSSTNPYYTKLADKASTHWPFHLKEGKLLDDYVTFEINTCSRLPEEYFDGMFGGCDGITLKKGMTIYNIRYDGFINTEKVLRIELTDSGINVEKIFIVSYSHRIIYV